jgi:hypothetical protein
MKNLLAALALIAAVNASAQVQTQPKTWIEGQHSGVKEPMAVAVKDAQKWNEIWRQHDASKPAPEVDFTQTSVVVVFLGETETAGIKVTIVVQQDPLDATRINVFYRRTASKKGFSAQVQSEPYAIVKVPRAVTIDVEADAPVSIPEPRKTPPATPKYDDKRVKALMDSIKVESLSFDGK